MSLFVECRCNCCPAECLLSPLCAEIISDSISYGLHCQAYAVQEDIPSSSSMGFPSIHSNCNICVLFSVYIAIFMSFLCDKYASIFMFVSY